VVWDPLEMVWDPLEVVWDPLEVVVPKEVWKLRSSDEVWWLPWIVWSVGDWSCVGGRGSTSSNSLRLGRVGLNDSALLPSSSSSNNFTSWLTCCHILSFQHGLSCLEGG